MTKIEAKAKLGELDEFIGFMASKGFDPKNIPTYRSILKDFESIDEMYPCEQGKKCIALVKLLISLFPDEIGAEV